MHFYFTIGDHNMSEIERAADINKEDFQSESWYRFYGLKEDEKAHILISYKDNLPNNKQESEIRAFLYRLGFRVKFEKEKFSTTINVGIRRDIRNHIFLSAALIKTILGVIENKLSFEKDAIYSMGFPRYKEKGKNFVDFKTLTH